MRTSTLPSSAACLLAGLLTSQAAAAVIDLQEYAFNFDGTVINPKPGGDPVPSSVLLAGFDTSTGLGSVAASIHGAGPHRVGMFFDHEIDQALNTFFNEVGLAHGTPPSGLSWEIDEPGFAFGDIYDNFVAGALDNAVGTATPDDVSVAFGWDFSLAPGEFARLEVLLGNTPPLSGFYLEQHDPDSAASIYFSSALSIGTTGVPEHGPTWAFLVPSLIGLLRLRARFSARS
jgi:hypothetical protein